MTVRTTISIVQQLQQQHIAHLLRHFFLLSAQFSRSCRSCSSIKTIFTFFFFLPSPPDINLISRSLSNNASGWQQYMQGKNLMQHLHFGQCIRCLNVFFAFASFFLPSPPVDSTSECCDPSSSSSSSCRPLSLCRGLSSSIALPGCVLLRPPGDCDGRPEPCGDCDGRPDGRRPGDSDGRRPEILSVLRPDTRPDTRPEGRAELAGDCDCRRPDKRGDSEGIATKVPVELKCGELATS